MWPENSRVVRTTLAGLRIVVWLGALLAVFGLLAFVFGYFDGELAVDRRLYGCALIVGGMIIVLPAAARLAEDWPRLRPEHSVDAAFFQIGVGIVVLTAACFLGGRFAAWVRPMVDPEPKWSSPAAQAEAASRATGGDPGGNGSTTGRSSSPPQR